MNEQFVGKVAFVTGAASGIGRATALQFAERGAIVIVSDMTEDAGQETVALIQRDGGEALFIQTDVSDADQVKQSIDTVVNRYKRLDFGINNAGIGGIWSRTAEYPHENWDQVMAVNLTGVFYCMQYELQQMLSQGSGGSGVIVNTSSVAGLRALPNSPAYTASKHGVIGLTKTAAAEYARNNIRVNAVCPVFTRTPLFEQILEADASYEERLVRQIPMRRFGTPEDIASAIIWLCSEESSFVTGQAIQLDGGLNA